VRRIYVGLAWTEKRETVILVQEIAGYNKDLEVFIPENS
jgi:hypothetical protein